MATTLHPAVCATPGIAAQLDALLHAVAVAPLKDIGWIRVTGEDRVRWLNGMATNAIQSLQPGQGCYNFFLNAQGRIQADATAWMLEDSILLEAAADRIPAVMAMLDRFIIMDDVELTGIGDRRTGILIAGPHALRTVQELGGAPCSAPAPPTQLPTNISLKQTAYRGAPVDLIQAHSPLVPRFEVWADSETVAQISTELASIPKADPETLETLRILEGTPRYGTDIRNSEIAKDLPQETGQARALHFSKGCYLGQEIVERIHSRGNVHRAFSGFRLTGSLPSAGTLLESDGKSVGELTSVAAIPLPTPIHLALGYIRREALDRNALITYSGGTATPLILPYPGPFVQSTVLTI